MRDLDRWKDKVEISLDGRQIFFLFFGSAVAACLIFVVGVLIGKRIEARALALAPPPIEDPLAALDQLGDADEADEGLTFHKALAASAVKTERPVGEKKPAVKPAAPIAEKKVEPKKEPAAKVADDDGDDEDKPAAAEASKPEAKLEAKAELKKAEPKKAELGKTPPLPAARPQVVASNGTAAKKPDATASHFTLQLSAFPEKSDAEEFMKKIQAAGYKPFLVASEIPGKGVFYRVRVGDYASRQAAVDAKTDFEKKQRIIAYVAKL